ncbi:MAG: DUF4091 domain-containing protein [Chitinophagaceae bacterium]|nr:DUF4091 domain-containing protein [Chitinophagaceae bacterium]
MSLRNTATVLFLFFQTAVFAQHTPGQVDTTLLPVQYPHYMSEYAFDAPVSPQVWTEQPKGLHVSFASTDRAWFRTEVPELKASDVWKAVGWRGERLNTQLLVWSPDTLEQVRVIPGDLTSAAGKTISHKHITLNLVRYVLSNYPYGAKDAICGPSPYKKGYLMPDRFQPLERFQLPGRTVRPIWLTVDVPADATPGIYKGVFMVHTDHDSRQLQISIEVQPEVLPPPHEWQYRLDLWQNPWVIAWRNHLQPWSEEHKALLKKHLQLYADAGGKYITTYAVHSPWADNSYMIEGGMIDWIKGKDGKWRYDFTIFDTYVTLAMQTGVDKAITIYTPVSWGDRFRYTDESTGNAVYATWAPGTPDYITRWNHFLTALKGHLEKKGWFSKTYIGINESEMSQTLAAIKVIKKHSKDWKITYAGNWHKELDGLLDDYCFLYGNEPGIQQLKDRAARGATSTYYVCCNPAKPNNFVFSPPVEGRWISWYAAAAGYNGFLRWAYDAWPEDPVRDARFGSWPAGDCFLVYPGAGSCVRFEKLREGIADFEKIRILKRRMAGRTGEIQQLWKTFEDHLKNFTTEHDFNEEKITGDVDKGRAMVDELSRKLK